MNFCLFSAQFSSILRVSIVYSNQPTQSPHFRPPIYDTQDLQLLAC